jgi:hypothetical protein
MYKHLISLMYNLFWMCATAWSQDCKNLRSNTRAVPSSDAEIKHVPSLKQQSHIVTNCNVSSNAENNPSKSH